VNTRRKHNKKDKAKKNVVELNNVLRESETRLMESTKTENKRYQSLENLGLSIPERMDLDETRIYDIDLIQKIQAAFREWRTGWIEQHDKTGEEFDPESYTEALPKLFLTDFKLSIKTKVAI